MKYTCNKIDCCHHLMKSCHRETDCSPLSLTLIPLRKIKCFSLFLLSCSSLHYFVSLKKNSHFEKNEVNYKNSLKKLLKALFVMDPLVFVFPSPFRSVKFLKKPKKAEAEAS